MSAHSEALPHVARQCTHVGASRAGHADVDHRRGDTSHLTVTQVEQVEGLDRHLALGDLDVLPRADAFMRATSVDAYGAHRTGSLAHEAPPRPHGGLDIRHAQRGTDGMLDLSLRVVAARRHAEGDSRDVLLALRRQVAEQARGRPEPQDEHARGEGVERACVTHPARTPGLARTPDDGVRRGALGLVHDDDAVGAGNGHPAASSSSEGWR